MRCLLATVALLGLLALVGCGGDDDDATTAAAPTATPAAPDSDRATSSGASEKEDPPGTELVAADSDYGSILFDSKQRAIYLFDRETSESSECYGACAEAWPPVVTDGEPRGGAGVEPRLLGTTERDDGSTQVTYNGHPLYYYVDDLPGEVLCQNVEEFGGLWLVVEPGGDPVS